MRTLQFAAARGSVAASEGVESINVSGAATPARVRARVLGHRRLSATAFELELERQGIAFRAGQLLTIHGGDLFDDRSYSIASGERDDAFRVLYRLIPEGRLTPRLARLAVGDEVEISAPYGEFVLRDTGCPVVFIATGTGIAPGRSFARTFPGLDLTVLHGVRTAEDLFYRDDFAPFRYMPCVSSEETNGFRGRVTDRARGLTFQAGAHFYLCGANEMFYEMRDVLREQGVPADRIFTEAYYYRHEE